jgi:hypothetical protein
MTIRIGGKMLKNANYMKRMGELLVFHKILNRPEDLTEGNFEEMIVEFQEKVDIMADGNPKWETLWQLQYPWVLQNPKIPFVKCDADKIQEIEGYDHLWLRQDAAEKYNALRKETLSLGGVLPTAGGKRELVEKESAGRSVTSMHYPGLAFDIATTAGFFKPDTDPFVVAAGGNGFWEVWLRIQNGPDMKINVFYWDGWNSGIDRTKMIQGKFINFTTLCAKYGFYPIRPRKNFTRAKDRKFIGCEWWHFQATDLLIPNLSQLGIELLKIDEYKPDYIRNINESLWSRKQALYLLDWF